MFTGLYSLSVPGSKVPNWFMCKCTSRYIRIQDIENPDWFMYQTLSCTVSRISEEGLHIREMMVWFVIYVNELSCTHQKHVVNLLIKRKGREKDRLPLGIYPGTHRNQIYIYHFRVGIGFEFQMNWLKDGDQIEFVSESTYYEDQIEVINESGPSLTPSLGFPCYHLKQAGIHLVYESEDTEDSIEEKLADFFNSLHVQWQLTASLYVRRT
ncbi:hypothetical protein AMTRI_Chr05g67530 [Amborella trichopoda]